VAGVRKGNIQRGVVRGDVAEAAHALVAQQYSLYNDALIPAFASQGMQIISHGERNPAQRKWGA